MASPLGILIGSAVVFIILIVLGAFLFLIIRCVCMCRKHEQMQEVDRRRRLQEITETEKMQQLRELIRSRALQTKEAQVEEDPPLLENAVPPVLSSLAYGDLSLHLIDTKDVDDCGPGNNCDGARACCDELEIGEMNNATLS